MNRNAVAFLAAVTLAASCSSNPATTSTTQSAATTTGPSSSSSTGTSSSVSSSTASLTTSGSILGKGHFDEQLRWHRKLRDLQRDQPLGEHIDGDLVDGRTDIDESIDVDERIDVDPPGAHLNLWLHGPTRALDDRRRQPQQRPQRGRSGHLAPGRLLCWSSESSTRSAPTPEPRPSSRPPPRIR